MIETQPQTLEIFVLPDCIGCERASQLVERVRAMLGDSIVVRLIDLSDPATQPQPEVFAVPTYVLNGRRLCLGNPDEEWLLHRLRM